MASFDEVTRARVAAGVWAVLVAWSLWTGGPAGPPAWSGFEAWFERFDEAGGDKLVHAVLFAVQGWLVCRIRREGVSWPWLGGCFAATSAFGVLTEAGQLAVETRTAEALDAAADVAGAAVGVGLFALLRRAPPRR
ncbi:MAG: VanZ family protein [Thermoanaerobaculia bacterium]